MMRSINSKEKSNKRRKLKDVAYFIQNGSRSMSIKIQLNLLLDLDAFKHTLTDLQRIADKLKYYI